tara:strand:+ start:1840 stop:2487 length:648 start_codon:yes stop_codon:yes gene_type:complete
MKYNLLLLLFPIYFIAQTEAGIDDYEIVNLFIERHSKPLLSNEKNVTQHFYLKKTLGNDFNGKCLGTLKFYLSRYRRLDALCEINKPSEDRKTNMIDACLLKENFKKSLALSKEEIDYFDTHEFANTTLKILNPKKIKKPAIIVDDFSISSCEIENVSRTVILKGPFYNYHQNKAFLEWYSGSLIDGLSGSSNCILYIKEEGVWKEVGNFNYGHG